MVVLFEVEQIFLKGKAAARSRPRFEFPDILVRLRADDNERNQNVSGE